MRHLSNCYSFLSTDVQSKADSLLDNALASHRSEESNEVDAARWQLRPKLHLLMELCAEDGPPSSSSWNYREKSLGVSVTLRAITGVGRVP